MVLTICLLLYQCLCHCYFSFPPISFLLIAFCSTDKPQGGSSHFTKLMRLPSLQNHGRKTLRHNRYKTPPREAPCASSSASEHSSGECIIYRWCLGGVQVSQGRYSLNKEDEVSASQRTYGAGPFYTSMSSVRKVLSEKVESSISTDCAKGIELSTPLVIL